MKTLKYPLLFILHLNSYISYSPMKFLKVNGGYKTSFIKKQVTDTVKFTAIIENMYGALSINELKSMKLWKTTFRIEALVFSDLIFKLPFKYSFKRRFNIIFNG